MTNTEIKTDLEILRDTLAIQHMTHVFDGAENISIDFLIDETIQALEQERNIGDEAYAKGWENGEKAEASRHKQTSEDCISREDALMCLTGQDLPKDRDEYIAIVNKRLKIIPSIQPKKGEWIPVTERLPEDDGDGNRVLTTTDEGNVIELIYSKKYGFMRGMFEYSNVIAWQPLPEPYKAESEE